MSRFWRPTEPPPTEAARARARHRRRRLGLTLCAFLGALLALEFALPLGRVWVYTGVMALAPEEAQVRAVGRLGSLGPVAAPSMRLALQNPNARVRAEALRSLERWEPQSLRSVAPQLVQLLADDSWVAAGAKPASIPSALSEIALRRLGDEALPFLRAGLEDGSSEIRRAAAAFLERAGPAAKSCLPALAKLEDDDDAQVRAAARRAVSSLTQLRPR